MPLDKSIKKVLVIGSGPIVIGQAAEFDYAGTQACRVLKEDNIEIVLVNSNPATIMTDTNIADKIYIEPLTLETVKRIIKKEKPDGILSGLGGQTGLTLSMKLAKEGFLDEHGVRLLGSLPETIDKAEDRQIFKDTMLEIGEPCIPSKVVTDVETAVEFVKTIGYPVIVRPAFTMGGSGGGSCADEAELRKICDGGIKLSPIGQVLVEKSIAGWKEIEFEVMRDRAGNSIIVCSMENFDPVGVHTGDSIVIAPCVTLSNKEFQMLRTASLNIVNALGVEGGCNCQLALNPDNFEYAVIEVNPRVSRSSALASKATGYPIAKVATKVAIGYTLDEITNAVTGTTYAAFEPSLDYVAVKFPKWPFDKFVYAAKGLGTQMKATGEVMSIADTFEEALLKAVRGAEIGFKDLSHAKFEKMGDDELVKFMLEITDERLFALYECIKRGKTIDELHDLTKIDKWFLHCLLNIKNGETHGGFKKKDDGLIYKMVDTCAAEFEAKTPYFYSIENGEENEALPFIERSKKERIVVLGSGPIRIGQGIEFDYACVHCVWTLRKMGYEVIVINNNPETVSTDFDTADRLYFEPLCFDDVMSIIDIEKPIGVIVAFGGGTAIKLTKKLHESGVKIIGTSADSVDACEDRERFEELLEEQNIGRPKGFTIMNETEALEAAHKLGFPVLMRPSYVLGGQNMIIAFTDEDIKEYMEIILRSAPENPVLIDKYLSGTEIEVDAICDGDDVLIPGIMEHIEKTGVHSGDSIAVYPAVNVDDELADELYNTTRKLCMALKVKGLVNIQYVLHEGKVYVIEVNPRASRTVPYISKVTHVPMCELATKVSVGEKLRNLGYSSGIAPIPPYVATKVPVFSFEKLTGLDTHLGPEMKSTGEVLGIGKNLAESLYKGLLAAGYKMAKANADSGVIVTVRDSDKADAAKVAKKFAECGFKLYATGGTAKFLTKKGFEVEVVGKIRENPDFNTETLLESGKISYIISTSEKGRDPALDDVKIRRKATTLGIPCLTSVDTAGAVADSLLSGYSEINTELVNINEMRSEKLSLKFTKMHGTGNDYIYFNCLEKELEWPESFPVILSNRHTGIGGDGVVLICKSDVADAKMRMFNIDGSEGAMCGNAVRCVAKYLYDNRIVNRKTMTIETKSGVKSLKVITKNNIVSKVTVDMGAAILEPAKIPVKMAGDNIINQPISVDGKEWQVTCLSMGNPHAVTFCEGIENLDLEKIGPKFENHELFPDRINTEFVEIVGENRLKMRVYERGSGETMACGSGACAAAVAAILNNLANKNEDVIVEIPGGELIIKCTDDTVFLTGAAVTVYEGEVRL